MSWARPPAAAALALCNGGNMASLKLPDGLIDPSVAPVAGLTAEPFKTPGGNTVSSFILQPTPITADNLQVVARRWPDHQGGALQGRRRLEGAGGLQVASTPTRPSICAPGSPGGAGPIQRPDRGGPPWRTSPM